MGMNLGNKVSFGFSAVVAGQKTSGNNEPQLIVNSTKGKFTVTSPVTRAMGIAVGEYIQFVNNIAQIEAAINEGREDIKAVAAELGVDYTTREGALAIIDACTQWAIVKGQAMLDKVGNPIMVSARLTEEEKRAFIAKNAAAILAENRDALIERNGGEDADDETLLGLIELDEVEYPKVPGFTGSKTASTSNATGVGLQLGFTDSNVWSALKKDLGEDATKKNRIFKVLLDDAVKTTVDGKDTMIYPIEFQEDADPIRVGK